VFQSRSDQKKHPCGPPLSVSTTSTTSTSPSTAPIDTPVSTYSLREPSYALPYTKDGDRSTTSLHAGRRETWPTATPTRKEPSPDSKLALGEVRRDKPSRGEEHNQFACMKATRKSVTPNEESAKTGEGPRCGSSARASSGVQANALGERRGISPGDTPTQVSSGKGATQKATRAQVDEVSSLEAKVAETKVQIEDLTATRKILDKELNKLTSQKETLQDEIAYYVKMKAERSRPSSRKAPVPPSRSRTAPAPSRPSKDAEGSTSILSALFLLHDIVTSDTLQ
jgi:hypothetical protein